MCNTIFITIGLHSSRLCNTVQTKHNREIGERLQYLSSRKRPANH